MLYIPPHANALAGIAIVSLQLLEFTIYKYTWFLIFLNVSDTRDVATGCYVMFWTTLDGSPASATTIVYNLQIYMAYIKYCIKSTSLRLQFCSQWA